LKIKSDVDSMLLYIKNMVCNRCREAVKNILEKQQLHPQHIELGEVTVLEEKLSNTQKTALKNALQEAGFELISNRSAQLIESIKTFIVQMVHYTEDAPKQNYSELLSTSLHHDYSALSKLFSETEGITIEQYIIHQKIERVKELLVYDELSLAQIALQMEYSSTAHLSAQFKKITGMTPTQFKGLRKKKRKPLDEIGRTVSKKIT